MQEHSKKIQEFSAGLRHHTDGSRQPYFTYCKKRDPHRRVFWLWSGYDHFSAQHHHDRQTFRRLLHPTNLRPTDSSNGFKLPYNIRPGKLMTTIRDFTSCSSGSIPLSTPHVCHAGWSCCWLPVPMLHFAVCSEEIRSPWDWYGLPPWPAFLSVRNSPNFS